MTPDLERQLKQRIGLSPGDLLTSDTMGRISAAARSIDEHIVVGFSRESRNSGDSRHAAAIASGRKFRPRFAPEWSAE
jgi:hypothetical protein